MFSIDISDASIEALKLKKNLFGKKSASSIGRIELEEGIVKNGEILDPQKLAEKIGGLVKKGKINFTLPDLRIFTHRFLLPSDVSRSAVKSFLKEKVIKVVPFEFDDLVYDFKIINEIEEGKKVLFIAAPKKILAGYLKTLEMLKLIPFSAVPESLAAFEIFKETVVKDEMILYVDVGSKTSTFSFFDRFGPFLTLNEPVKTNSLQEEVKKAGAFLKEKHNKEIKRIILGGGGSLEVDGESFSKEIGTWTTKADKILSDKLAKTGIAFNAEKASPVLFLNVLGLSLLTGRKDELNLLKETKNLLTETVEKELKEKDENGKENGENKEGKKAPSFADSRRPEPMASDEASEGKGDKDKKEKEEGKEKSEEEKEENQEEVKKKSFFSKIKSLFKFKRLLIIVIAALLTFFGIYLFIKKPFVKKQEDKKQEEQTPVVSPVVSPAVISPTTAIERKDLKIKILNGSGIAGRAGEASDALEELGYEIIATGNAGSFDYEETVIEIKEEKKDFLSLLTNDLKSVYTVSSKESLLSDDEEADVVVIIGKE